MIVEKKVVLETKLCPGCRKARPLVWFHFRTSQHTIRRSICKLCVSRGNKLPKKAKPSNEELDEFKEALRAFMGKKPLNGERQETVIERFTPSLIIFGDGNRQVHRRKGA